MKIPLTMETGEEFILGFMEQHSEPRIVRVLSVRDTRQYEEIGDRWVPIPGSGHEHECSRCGRLHEIHAEVELSDGSTAIVGTGCMGAESLEIQSRVKSMTSAAKTLARNRATLAAIKSKQAAYDAAWNSILALPVPPIEIKPYISAVGQRAGQVIGKLICCGDGYAVEWDSREYSESNHQERVDCATGSWRVNRLRELGFQSRPYSSHLEESVRKLERKLSNDLDEKARVR